MAPRRQIRYTVDNGFKVIIVDNLKKFIKKNVWAVGIVTGGIVLAVAMVLMISHDAAVKDGMFYEVKCRYGDEDKTYSLIVDDKPAALAFREDMETNVSELGDRAKCKFMAYPNASNDTLFMYAIVTVLNNVTFGFKEESIRDDTYQIQFFTAKDAVAALSCRYAHAQFDCYGELPVSDCPARQADAIKLLKTKCEYKPL